MKRFALLCLLAAPLSGCQAFVDFDRDLLDGGDGGGSSMRVAHITDAGVPPDATDDGTEH